MNFSVNLIDPCNMHSEDRPVAAALAISAAIAIVLGLNFQKKSKTAPYPVYTWIFGLGWVIGGVIMYLFAYKYAPDVFVAPLLSLIIIFNMVFAQCMNHEHIDINGLMYTLTICGGCMLTGFASSVCQHESTPNQTMLIAYSVPVGVGLVITSLYGVRIVMRYTTPLPQVLTPTQIRSVLSMWAAILFSSATLIGRASLQDDKLAPLGAATAVLGLLGLGIVRIAFELYEAFIIIPIVISMTVSLTVIGGGMIFGEFQQFEAVQMGEFIMGIVLDLVGTIMMASHYPTTTEKQRHMHATYEKVREDQVEQGEESEMVGS